MSFGRVFVLLIAVAALLLVIAPGASASPPPNAPNPGPAAGGQTTSPQLSAGKKSSGNGNCSAGALALNALNPFSHCNLGAQAANGAGQLPGDVAGVAGSAAKGLAGDAMDQVSSWMVQAAQTVDGDVMKAVTSTSTPELSAPWYQQEFGYLALFGAALAAIVALVGLMSASVRGDPQALGEIFYGVLRAGLVTTMVISLTLLALKVADGISGDVAQHMPRQFFQTLATAWGTQGWGGLASSALAFVTALVEVVVAVLLWIELLFRDAAIYVAVLFFPFTLAMAIWPRLAGAHAKLARMLGIFIAFKPVALIVMMTGANLLLGGISFYGGVGRSVGTILAGLAVLAMAAFAPWALMQLAGLDAGVMGGSGARRRGDSAGGGSADGRSAGGAPGGELFGGTITYGGAAAAAGGVAAAGAAAAASEGSRGDKLAVGRGVAGVSAGADAGGGHGAPGGRILPGPIAAAAGLLPAGWQATRSLAAVGQSLASHGAARVHTASGHGGTQPPPLGSGGGRDAGVGRSSPHGGEGPPDPPPIDVAAPPDAGRDRSPGGTTGDETPTPPGDAGNAGGESSFPPPPSDQPITPPAPEQPFPPPREEP